ncbi:MAG: transketolase [bacterium]|nr:transketolase [bacterium]
MESQRKAKLEQIALSIRSLSMDAIQKANSGHPGLPLGCAEIGAVLYGGALKYYQKDLDWINRDRFVLSAGHGSMFLYSLLHLSGCGLSLDDIKDFRQLHSTTPGHPEVYETPGVEMTTGPLGQGLAASVGMALAGKILGERFNKPDAEIFNYNVFSLAGDGCIMEGVAHEACSLAGHLGLSNFTILYDANDICLDGDLKECFSEDVWKRFESYGFEVTEIDGHDLFAVEEAFEWAKTITDKPQLIICKTTIGYGSPNKAGTSSAHGSPLGPDELKLTKANLGLDPEKFFQVNEEVYNYFRDLEQSNKEDYEDWQDLYLQYQEKYPKEFSLLNSMREPDLENLESKLPKFEAGEMLAGRKSSQACIQVIADKLPSFIGGSADLSCSDSTTIKSDGIISSDNSEQRNIKYGVREFGMSAVAAGMALTGFFRPLVGTFLCFSDYLRPSLRLSSLIGLPVIYQFTHDSVFLGEDGPTHQPVEHAAALRTIPGTNVFRPADGNEVRGSWLSALSHRGPSALLLSRQNLPHLSETSVSHAQGVARGAYEVFSGGEQPDRVIYSSGSELHLAIEAAKDLKKKGESVRVISVPCWELFEQQSEDYKNQILTLNAKYRHSIEAQITFGWHRFVGLKGQVIGLDRFGYSAPADQIQQEIGFTVQQLVDSILSHKQ